MRAISKPSSWTFNHLLRRRHLASLKQHRRGTGGRTGNDKFVSLDLLTNATSRGRRVPMCQDHRTPLIIMGKKARFHLTDGEDEGALAEGRARRVPEKNRRYSQLAPVSMFEEKNTTSNMPAHGRALRGG